MCLLTATANAWMIPASHVWWEHCCRRCVPLTIYPNACHHPGSPTATVPRPQVHGVWLKRSDRRLSLLPSPKAMKQSQLSGWPHYPTFQPHWTALAWGQCVYWWQNRFKDARSPKWHLALTWDLGSMDCARNRAGWASWIEPWLQITDNKKKR